MILTINCGSSSLKYQLYTPDLGEVAAKGIISRIGEAGTSIDHRVGGRKIRQDLPGADHAGALEAVIANLLHPEWGRSAISPRSRRSATAPCMVAIPSLNPFWSPTRSSPSLKSARRWRLA